MTKSSKTVHKPGNQPQTILVLGATGYTGQMIVAELARLGQSFMLGGRDRTRLENLRDQLNLDKDIPILVADPTHPATLLDIFKPEIGVVINCIGPFTKLGEPVVQAAIDAGIHYLDITGEQAYLARIVNRYNLMAQQRGCVIVPACGVEYTMTNWAAALAADQLEPLDEIWTATATKNINPSRGTQLSLLEALAQPGFGWQNQQTSLKQTASSARWIEFPAPFGECRSVWAPFGELVTIPRHIQVKNMNSYFATGTFASSLLQIVAPILPLISRGLGNLTQLVARKPETEKDETSEWAIMAHATGPKGSRTIVLQGTQVYKLTAIIISWCATKMLEPEFKSKKRGVLGPAQAFDPQEALHYLQNFGVTCENRE